MTKTTPRRLTDKEAANLHCLGWTIASTCATSAVALGGNKGAARITVTAAGAWTVKHAAGQKSGTEAEIYTAAMVANEVAWAIRDHPTDRVVA